MLQSRMRALFIRSITIVAHRIRSLPPTTSSSNRLIGKALIASALMSGIALHAAQLRTDNSALDPVDAELAIEATEHALAPSSDDYVRIDLTTLASPEFRESFLQSNALHDTLNGQGMIETFQVFHHKTDSDLFSIVKFGDRVNGYPGLVHGGISSLVMDSLYGWTFMANKLPPAFTANLTLNYRKPVFANTTVVVKSRLVKMEGRKIYMDSVMLDASGEVLIESTTLFITHSLIAQPKPAI